VYSYHSFNDFITNKESENILSFLKKNGFVKKIGISIYTNEQFISAIDNDSIDVIQIPFSILDNHNNRGLLINKARERSKEIHCRSVFLQGLIFMNEQNIPVKLRPLLNYITKLQKFSMEENLSLEELALTYVMNYHGIDGILIGVENVNQLVSNMNSVRSDKAEKISEFIDSIHVSEKDLLNPQNWK
jgi:aryl-alcohol dehydrogenase-like predicted oxidoreductase